MQKKKGTYNTQDRGRRKASADLGNATIINMCATARKKGNVLCPVPRKTPANDPETRQQCYKEEKQRQHALCSVLMQHVHHFNS